MQSDVRTQKHASLEVANFKGLYTAAEDARVLPEGFLGVAHNVVFDALGNIRPKDGSAQWWAPLSQRVYLAEMEPAEDATWTGGSASLTAAYGYQSRVINAAGATVMSRALPVTVDLLLDGGYTEAQTTLSLMIRAATPADNTVVYLFVSSDPTFTTNIRRFDITAAVNAAAAGTWTEVTAALASGTDISGAPDFSAIAYVRIALTQTAGSDLFFDELYAKFSVYNKSFCLGGIEYRRTTDSRRFAVAGFGDTIFVDQNEAQTPAKIVSGLTRDVPLNFETMEDRLAIFNGVDDNLIYDGDKVRKLGFPAPTSWTPGFTYSNVGGGGLANPDEYYYGIVFVYGAGSLRYGQSTIYASSTKATVSVGNNTINLANIPVGAVGSSVVARRIFRSRKNAGPLATKYLVAELANNTDTTYADGIADDTIILNAEAPYNNGVPPIAKAAYWFQKGAVYITKTAVYYSRPGFNLDETSETVPAENVIPLGHMGDLIGCVEFNNNLYLWARRGLGKLQWKGSALEHLSTQRASESRAQGVGAADARAITVIKDRYVRWIDTEGQVWRMLPNEEILPESSPVKNLVGDVNVKPLSSNLDFFNVDAESQWANGSLDAASNLTTSEKSGNLAYKQSTLGAITVTGQTATLAESNASENNLTSGVPGAGAFRTLWTAGDGHYEYIKLKAANAARGFRLDSISLRLEANGLWDGAHPVDVVVVLYKSKYETSSPSSTGLVSDQVTISPTLADVLNPAGIPVTFNFASPAYVPGNESIYVGVAIFGTFVTASTIGLHATSSNLSLLVADPVFVSAGDPAAVPRMAWTGKMYDEGEVTLATIDGGATLQRWHRFSGTANLRSGGRLNLTVQYSSDGTTWGLPGALNAKQLLYYKKFLLQDGGAAEEPVFEEEYYFAYPPDYRVDEPFPSSTQYRYARYIVQFSDAGSQPTPATEALSKVSIAYADTFPQVTNPTLTVSTEASFATYNKKDYLRDIWTSPIVATAGISAFGRLAMDAFLGQQDIYVQLRTATSSAGIAAATWFDVTPNTLLGTTNLVASATHFQIRVIFQDSNARFDGVPSYVSRLLLSWKASGADISPVMPPVLYHAQDYTFMSWVSSGSRILDKSAALDDHADAFAEATHRWSTFDAPHYACYFTAGGKLVGGTSTGGRVNLLRQSAVTEADGRVVRCYVETLPYNLRTMFLKTLHWMYLGMVLNIHRTGHFLKEVASYPTAAATNRFSWHVRGNNMPSVGIGPASANALQIFGTYRGDQATSDLLPHSPTRQVLLTFPNMKPYQAEYGFDMGVQERAFIFAANWTPFLDAAGNSIFPTMTNLGMEYFIENIRGL